MKNPIIWSIVAAIVAIASLFLIFYLDHIDQGQWFMNPLMAISILILLVSTLSSVFLFIGHMVDLFDT